MRLVLYIIAVCVLLILFIRYLENRTLFVPAKEILGTPSSIGLAFEELTIRTEDGIGLNAWLIKKDGAQSTLLFCHGNAGNIGDRLFKLELFHNLGLNVLIFDYRGYGKSEGTPTEQGVYTDARAAYDYLRSRQDIDASKIMAYGASLGGAVCIDLATKRDLAALIVDSSFTNAADMAKRIFPFIPSFLINTKLDSLSKIKKFRNPAIFFHSVDDEIVPHDLGRKLYEAANEPKTFVALLGSHNEGMIQSEKILANEIKRFLEKHQL